MEPKSTIKTAKPFLKSLEEPFLHIIYTVSSRMEAAACAVVTMTHSRERAEDRVNPERMGSPLRFGAFYVPIVTLNSSLHHIVVTSTDFCCVIF